MAGVKGRSGRPKRRTNDFFLVAGRNKQRIVKDAQERIEAPLIEYPGLGEVGKAFRDAYYKMMVNNQTWSVDYSEGLHLLANAAEQWHKADEALKKGGDKEPIYDNQGRLIGTKPSGLFRIERERHEAYLALLRDFGRLPRYHDDVKRIAAGKKINPFAGKI